MSNNLLIVESHNDKFFVEAFINHLNLPDIEVNKPICNIDEFECLGGISNLTVRLLNEVAIKIAKGEVAKLGIILDADQEGIAARVTFINNSLKEICSDINMTRINTLERSEELDISIACYITNVNGKGELETLMKLIKSKPSIAADCLDSWRSCLVHNGKEINDKYFDKLWVQFYQRYDICTVNESNAYKNCSGETSIKKDIWNFEHLALTDLKAFLTIMGS